METSGIHGGQTFVCVYIMLVYMVDGQTFMYVYIMLVYMVDRHSCVCTLFLLESRRITHVDTIATLLLLRTRLQHS